MSLGARHRAALAAAGLAAGASALSGQSPPDPVAVELVTELGRIEIEVRVDAAPVTAANFLRYVDAGLYDDGTFYRAVRMDNQADDVVPIEVVQGGMNRARRDDAWPPIALEGTGTTGLRHVDGVVSMARAGPASARAEFFICIGDQPELDAGGRRNPDGLGFAAFGRVTRGMDVVRAIQAGRSDGQRLLRPVRILEARRRP